MGVYHLLAQAFPIVLWNTAFLFTIIRTFSDTSLARRLGDSVTALTLLGVLAGAVTYALGFLVWPFSALIASPLARDHIMLATWSLAFWTVVLVFSWRLGESKWHGANRWIMAGLVTLGAALVNIAGTLGGSIAHNPSAVGDVVRFLLSWTIYTTHYVPDITLWLLAAAAIALVVIGVRGHRRRT
jgi:hypothetical protein